MTLLPAYDTLVTYANLEYKKTQDRSLFLDIIKPTQTKQDKVPAVVFIHGGSWYMGDKSGLMSKTCGEMVPYVLEAGFAIVSISYRLIDEKNLFPENIIDVKDAIKWLRKEGEAYGIDTDRIGLWGSSAGAHLALMAAFTKEDEFLGMPSLSEIPTHVDYVIDVNGPTDFYLMIEQMPKDKRQFLCEYLFGKGIDYNNLKEEEVARLTSYFPVAKEYKVPVLILHGTMDEIVPMSHSEVLYGELREAGVDTCFRIIQGAGHSLVPITEEDTKEVIELTVNFMLKYTTKASQQE